MSQPESTVWAVISGAAKGQPHDREEFAHRYSPTIRTYLAARWRSSTHKDAIDDAVQEVFVECFRPGGVLERADPQRAGGFRAFLYGVVRNVALRLETSRARDRVQPASGDITLDGIIDPEESLARVFDRAWAEEIMRQAGRRQADRARASGAEALERVELLQLRFNRGLPIREIARLWQTDAARLHHAYAVAREEFRMALLEVVAWHHPGTPEQVETECAELLSLLSK